MPSAVSNNNSKSTSFSSSNNNNSDICSSPVSNSVTEEDMVSILMKDTLTRKNNNNNKKTSPSSHLHLHPTLRPAASTIAKIWAKSTWESRARLYQRMQEFSVNNNISNLPFGAQATAFISNLPNLLPSSKLTYASSLRGIANKMAIETPLLSLYQEGLRFEGASDGTHTLHQATPASRSQVIALLDWMVRTAKSPRVAVGIYLCWKAASRFDDVKNLRKSSLIFYDKDIPSLILEWGATKANRAKKFLIQNYVEVAEMEFKQMLTTTILEFSKLQEDESIFGNLNSTQFVRLIQKCPGCQDLTAHSFKRGAAEHLFKAALNPATAFDVRRIPPLLKHKDELQDFPQSTLRYISNKVLLARAFKTADLTKLL